MAARDGGDVSIRTARLEVRPLTSDDATDLAAEANDARVAANLRDTFPNPYSLDDAYSWIELPHAPLQGLGIVRAGRVIGALGLEPGVGERRFDAELGYWLGVAHWGQGYATEAVAALCDHAFTTSMLQRVHAVVYDGNPGSDRVLDKCGFVLEGLSRRAIFKNGRFLDCRTYARLKA
jgi:RimJ/RimL family protein N-acetyltransferase